MLRAIRSISTPTGLAVSTAILVLAITALALVRYGYFGLVFLPVGLLAIPFLGRRILGDPIPVFCLFLVLIVNFDFIRFGESRFTLDILTSAVFLWALMVRVGLNTRSFLASPIERAFLAFIGLTFISVILSVSPGLSFKNWARDIEYLVIFSFVLLYRFTPNERKAVVMAVMASSIFPCLLGLVGMALKIPELFGQETPIAGGESVERIKSTLVHPVIFSHYLSVVATLTMAMIIDGKWFKRRYLVPMFALQLVLLYFTYGRTGWVEFVVASVVLLWLYGYRKVVFSGFPLAIVGLALVVPALLSRFANVFEVEPGADNSFLWRLGLWAYSLSLYPQKPIFGSGPDTFAEYVAYLEGFNSHHTWIGLLIETGAVGFLSFAILMIVVMKQLKKKRVAMGSQRNPLVIGAYAVVVGALAGSFAGDPFGLPAVSVYLWTIVALALGMPKVPDTMEEI